MSSHKPEQGLSRQDTPRSKNMTLELLISSLASLEARVSDMEETLDLLQVNSSEMNQIPYRSNRQGFRLRPVNTLKHVVETNGAVTAAAASRTDIINTIRNPDEVQTNQCEIGSTVSAIYLRVEVIGTVSAGGVDNIYMAVFKNPGGILVPPNLDQVGQSDKRKYVIHQEMIMLAKESNDAMRFPRTMFNGVVRIPRGYKRNGVEDKLEVVLQHRQGELTQQTEFCIECIYKEFR